MMASFTGTPIVSIRLSITLLIVILFVSGCSGSSSSSDSLPLADTNETASENGSGDESTDPVVSDPSLESTTDPAISENTTPSTSNTGVQIPEQVDFLLDEVAQPLLVEFGIFQSRTLSLVAGALVDNIRSTSEAEILIPQNDSGLGEPSPFSSQRFNCSAGGTVTVDFEFTGDIGTSSGSSEAMLNYLFDQCEHQFSGSRLPEGTHRITGNLLLEEDLGFGRGSRTNIRERWGDAEISLSNGLEYTINGEIFHDRVTTSNVDTVGRTANFTQYRKFNGDVLLESLENVSFEYNDDRSLGPTSILLDVSGSLTSSLTGNQSVSLLSNPPLTALTDRFDLPNSDPFSGTIEFSATDGSFVSLSPNPEQVIGEFTSIPEYRVDLDYTSPSGERRSNTNIELIEIPNVFGSCLLALSDGTNNCPDMPLTLP